MVDKVDLILTIGNYSKLDIIDYVDIALPNYRGDIRELEKDKDVMVAYKAICKGLEYVR